jgi:choline dehydrogenase
MWPFPSSYRISSLDSVDGCKFDYIIVGGGTAGCVLASRLSEDRSCTVLLVEQGSVSSSWLSRIPLYTLIPHNLPSMADVWNSEPNPNTSEKHPLSSVMISGKTLGGTSAINGGVVHRSLPAEYDVWGEEEWSWKNVEPLFKRAETSLTYGDTAHRGSQGISLLYPASFSIGSNEQ